MQREIKFRAWDGKEMVSCGLRDDGKCAVFFCSDEADIENWPLMQYTGLKDKNGKEIYEDDLFNCIYDFDGCTEHKLQVVWNVVRGAWDLKETGPCQQAQVSKFLSQMSRKEVIGNAWENPELLTGDNKQ